MTLQPPASARSSYESPGLTPHESPVLTGHECPGLTPGGSYPGPPQRRPAPSGSGVQREPSSGTERACPVCGSPPLAGSEWDPSAQRRHPRPAPCIRVRGSTEPVVYPNADPNPNPDPDPDPNSSPNRGLSSYYLSPSKPSTLALARRAPCGTPPAPSLGG